jgi:hypothetical protein
MDATLPFFSVQFDAFTTLYKTATRKHETEQHIEHNMLPLHQTPTFHFVPVTLRTLPHSLPLHAFFSQPRRRHLVSSTAVCRSLIGTVVHQHSASVLRIQVVFSYTPAGFSSGEALFRCSGEC